jgi:hypothetical protein
MDKDFSAAVRWRDESETAIIVPLRQSAFDAHDDAVNAFGISGERSKSAACRGWTKV